MAIFTMYHFSPYKEQHTVREVEVAYAEISDIYDSVVMRGTVIEQGRKEIFPDDVSTVEQRYVSAGDTVKKGQLLAVLQPVDDTNTAKETIYGDLEKTLQDITQSAAQEDMEGAEDKAARLAGAFGQLPQEEEEAESEKSMIYSPIDGVVMEISAGKGESISPLLPFISVSDMDDLAVKAEVSEDLISSISENMSCTIEVSALTDKKVTGRVSTIMPYARQTGLLSSSSEIKTQVIIDINNTDGIIRPGYSATAKAVTNVRRQATLVPYEAIRQDDDGNEYVLINDEGIAKRYYILTGSELSDSVEVTSAFDSQLQLIVGGEDIEAGMRVKVK